MLKKKRIKECYRIWCDELKIHLIDRYADDDKLADKIDVLDAYNGLTSKGFDLRDELESFSRVHHYSSEFITRKLKQIETANPLLIILPILEVVLSIIFLVGVGLANLNHVVYPIH
jgi:hypothetical protein